MIKLSKLASLLSIKILLSISVVFIILLIFILFQLFSLDLSGVFKKGFLQDKSIAQISLNDQGLYFKFDLTSKEREEAESFIQNLGGDESLLDGFSIKLDQATLEKLAPNLPIEVNVDFSPKQVKFSNNVTSSLTNALPISPEKSFTLATGSGSLLFNEFDKNSFNLKVYDPKPILEYATASSKLTLSKKLDYLFPILQKIGRIEIRASERRLSGEIELK